MSNNSSSFNLFVILLGFLLLGLPIILISYSTRPPTTEQFFSEINIYDIPSDSRSGIVLNETAKISGNSTYWQTLGSLPELAYINNISKMIEDEQEFLSNVSMSDYGGFKNNVHIFNLTMRIEQYDNNTATFYNLFYSLFGTDGESTFMFVKISEDTDAYSVFAENYPNVNTTIGLVEDRGIQIKYIISISFNGNLEREDGNYSISFNRILLIDNNEFPVFFISNERAWGLVK
ncbi:MAG: hypothetical protein ACTSQE_10185 [Candidatus Heimdallarchaeaceae archaeon]